MSITVAQQVTKQTNRIKRLVNQLTQKHPQLENCLDQIIAAVIKIEKSINAQPSLKYLGSSHKSSTYSQQPIQMNQPDEYNSYDDLFKQTTKRIERFAEKANKFERKMNIIIKQAVLTRPNKSKSYRVPAYSDQKPKVNTDRLGPKEILKEPKYEGSAKNPKARKLRIQQNESSGYKLRSIDEQIYEITEKIILAQQDQDQNNLE